MNDFEIDNMKVERLKRKIIIKENENLKTKDKDDPNMVKWIQKLIEEEVSCY